MAKRKIAAFIVLLALAVSIFAVYPAPVSAASTKPAAPTKVTAKAIKRGMKVSWKASKGATSYIIFASTKSKSGFKQIGNSNKTSFETHKLKLNTKYYFKIMAVNKNGKSGYSKVSNGVRMPKKIDLTGYIKGIMKTINELRNEDGVDDGILDAELCEKAQVHAEKMAKQGKIFHDCGGTESIGEDTVITDDGARFMGARLTAHNGNLALAEYTQFGVGAALSKNGNVFICVIARTE